MADAIRRSALDGHLHAHNDSDPSGVRLSEYRAGAMALIMGADNDVALADALSTYRLHATPSPGRCVYGEGVRVLWTGPNQYLMLSSRHRGDELERSLAMALSPIGAVAVDLSCARTVFRLRGPQALDVLAKGCPVDLEAMDDDASAATMLSHFNIWLHRRDDAFDVYVMRTFAVSCLHWLERAGHEFSMQWEVDAT